MSPWLRTIALAVLSPRAPHDAGHAGAPAQVVTPAPPELIVELRPIVERARQRFEARDAGGVLASVSEQYRARA